MTVEATVDSMRAERGPHGNAATVSLLTAVIAVEAVLVGSIWEPAHWQPTWLVVLLAAFIVLGEIKAVKIGDVYISSTTCATVLAMALLGPVPAAALVGAASTLDWLINHKQTWAVLTNVVVSSVRRSPPAS